jgi:hypothetical protein
LAEHAEEEHPAGEEPEHAPREHEGADLAAHAVAPDAEERHQAAEEQGGPELLEAGVVLPPHSHGP